MENLRNFFGFDSHSGGSVLESVPILGILRTEIGNFLPDTHFRFCEDGAGNRRRSGLRDGVSDRVREFLRESVCFRRDLDLVKYLRKGGILWSRFLSLKCGLVRSSQVTALKLSGSQPGKKLGVFRVI